MKISVITVCFNSADTIAATFESVAAQSYADIEHIVIDGGSKDGTLQVIDRYRNQLAEVVSEPDRGIYDAMNKGLALATGEVVGFLNADDVYGDTRVLERVANAITVENLDAIFGDVEFFRNDDIKAVVRRYRSARFRPDRIAWGWMPAHPTLFFRRNIFERHGNFRIDYRIAGDFDFVSRVFSDKSLKYRYLPEVLVRMRTGGVSTGGWRNTILLNREVLRACKRNGIRTNIFMILSKYPAKLMELLS